MGKVHLHHLVSSSQSFTRLLFLSIFILVCSDLFSEKWDSFILSYSFHICQISFHYFLPLFVCCRLYHFKLDLCPCVIYYEWSLLKKRLTIQPLGDICYIMKECCQNKMRFIFKINGINGKHHL